MRVLIVEDSIDDAELLLRELRKGGAGVEFERVETAGALAEALDRGPWDAVISDYSLPGLRGDEALRLVKARDPDLPFIFVSGTIGEETVVALAKAGADDYVMKGNLLRLPVSVARQLEAARERRARRRADEALRESEERFRQMAESIGDVFFLAEADNSRVHYVSPAYEKIWGRSRESVYAAPESFTEAIHPDDRAAAYERYRKGLESGEFSYQYRIVRPDGSIRWIEARGFPVRDAAGAPYRIAGVAEDITERVRMGSALKEREAGLRRAQSLAKLGHIVTGPGGSFERWSETLPELIALEPAQMPRSTSEWLERVHPEERASFRARIIEAAAAGKRWETEYRFRRGDGAWIDVRQVIEPLHGEPEPGGGARWFSTLQDVTEQRQAEARIRRLNRVYAVLSSINGLIVRVRERDELFREACRIAVELGKLRMAWIGVYDPQAMTLSPRAWHGHEEGFLRLMGLSFDDRGLVRHAIREKRAVIINDTEHDEEFRLREPALARGYRSGVVLPLTLGSELAGVLGLFADEPDFFDDEEMRLLAELAGDISLALEHIDKSERLSYLALYDPLTGLANRALFQERLAERARVARQGQAIFAVCLVDVDRFKTINDAFGQHAGDALLRQIAQRMADAAGDRERLARMAADRFAVVLPDVQTADDAARRVERKLRACFGPPFEVEGHELRISAKAGIALFPSDGTGSEALCANAEAALKKAKQTSENYLFYRQQMTERVAEKLDLENRLRQALDKGEFVLHYQAKVEPEGRRIVGLEALIRWQTPQGLVPPAQFIPLLEETGLILPAGAWAMRQAALEHRKLQRQGVAAPRIAVNVSPVQLRKPDFVASVRAALEDGASRPSIDLEITESLVMEDIAATIPKLEAVRDLGLEIAIDDFGTGYSSLAYLAKLPVHALKIDRSFIIAMLSDPNTMTLVSTIISLAHSLKLKVIAEGVDAEDQARVLRLLRCDQMQGYLFSKPLPLDETAALLAARAA